MLLDYVLDVLQSGLLVLHVLQDEFAGICNVKKLKLGNIQGIGGTRSKRNAFMNAFLFLRNEAGTKIKFSERNEAGTKY